MFSPRVVAGVNAVRKTVSRNYGVTVPALQKAVDPVQQLFVDKIREYRQKSGGGKLVDPSPEIEREMKAEMEKLAKIYGGDGKADMTQFPQFKFADPALDPIDMQAAK